jgi:hypothetical protein
MSAYPEHDKLAEVADQSQAIGEFIDWLSKEKGMHLYRYLKGAVCPVETNLSIQSLLAEFFEIDLKRLEDEKRAMLTAMRAANEAG